MLVVLDTNAMISEGWLLKSAAGQALLDALEAQRLTLCIPEVVYRELLTKHAEKTRETAEKFDKQRNDLLRLGHRAAEHSEVDYESELADLLDQTSADRLPLPQQNHERVLTRALARRPPFSDDGKRGYRDALLWETVLALCVDATEPVVFITDDVDFRRGASDGLAPELIEDLNAIGRGGSRLQFFRRLKDFVQAHIEAASQSRLELAARINSDPQFERALSDELIRRANAELPAMFRGVDPSTTGFGLVGPIQGAQPPEVVNVWGTDPSDLYVEVETEVTVPVFGPASRMNPEASTLERLVEASLAALEQARGGPSEMASRLGVSTVFRLTFEGTYDAASAKFDRLRLINWVQQT